MEGYEKSWKKDKKIIIKGRMKGAEEMIKIVY